MANTKDYKDYIWTFPLLGGILMIIGLLTPFSTGIGSFSWLWGGNYFEIGGDSYFYWTLEIYEDQPLIFISNITLFIVLLISSIGSIIYSLMVWKTEDFQRYERKWLYLGILFIIATIVYLIEFDQLMRHYYKEYLGLDASYWDFFKPGFGLIAPFLSGSIILIGFGVNKYFLPKKRDRYFKTIKLYRNIIISFLIGISIFFIGSLIVFSIFQLLPGDPVIAYLVARGIHSPSPAQIDAAEHLLGFDDPLIMQYFKFLFDFFTRNWGESISIARGVTVLDLLKDRAPITIDLLILPIILVIGNYIVLGIWLGSISYKYRRKPKGKVIQILCYFGISIPIFFFGMILQYFLAIKLDWFPATGYKDPTYKDPKYVTGFYIIDALLAGDLEKIPDYLYHLALPLFVLTIACIALITWQTRSYLVNRARKKSIISNTVITGTIFGFVFMFIIIIETTFGLHGMCRLLIDTINQLDYWVLIAVLFVIITMFAIISVISNIIFNFYKFWASNSLKRDNLNNPNNGDDKKLRIKKIM